MRMRIALRLLIGVLTVVAVSLIYLWYTWQPKPNTNALAIGNAATTQTTISVALVPPVDLNFLTKAQIFALRTEAAQRYPMLLKGGYQPADSVFGQIQDGRPWWGTLSIWYYSASASKGERSILGKANQSRFLMNPYLLIAADVSTYTINQQDWNWNVNKVTQADLDNPDFPLFAAPTDLKWMPAARRAEVTYHLTQYAAAANPFMANTLRSDYFTIDLTAYNARDLNLNYLFVAYADSLHISKDDPPTTAYENPQFLHTGNSCGYLGGCNNRSPTTPILDNLQITAVPASLTILLWKDKPGAVSDTPDFTYIMHFD